MKDGVAYKCLLIEANVEVRDTLLDGQCDDPSKDYLKEKIDATAIVREFFPSLNDDAVINILWNHTGFPEFWDIPKDGWTASQCLRTQLSKLKAKQSVMELV
jgi:hypothetical protein